MAAEREMMFCLQPAVIGAAEFCKRSEFDHGIFPLVKFALFELCAEAAVDIEHGAGHERRAGACQKHDAGRDLFSGAVTLQRVLGALAFPKSTAALRVHVAT